MKLITMGPSVKAEVSEHELSNEKQVMFALDSNSGENRLKNGPPFYSLPPKEGIEKSAMHSLFPIKVEASMTRNVPMEQNDTTHIGEQYAVAPLPSTLYKKDTVKAIRPRHYYIAKASVLTSRNRLKEALAIYNEGLSVYPGDSDLLNCKGVCLRNLNFPEEAFHCYLKALESNSSNASAWNNRGVLFKEKEAYDSAIQCYMMALYCDRNHKTATENLAVAYTDLGTKLKSEGRHEEALVRYYEALRIDPTYSPCLYNLGVILCERREYSSAMSFYLDAIRLNPRYVEAFNNIGAICKNLGHLYEAIMYYERALQLNPNFEMSKGNIAVALTDLGTQVKIQGNTKEGIRLYKKALVYNPLYGEAYYNLGVAYGEQYKYAKALVFYELAVTFNPRCAEAYNNLGVIYKDKENLDKAVYYYNKALEVNPRFAQTLNNIGVIYTVVGKMTEAHEFTRRALEVNPYYAEAYNNLGVLYRDQGDVALAIEAYEKSITLDPNARNALQNRLLALNYLEGMPVDTIYKASKEWGENFIAHSRIPFTYWKCIKEPHRRITVGYIGPDFFTHSVSYFIHGPLLYHNASQIRVIVYANVVKEDDKTQLFKKLVPTWKSIVGMTDRAVAEMIREDEVDILVELSGHTANNRLDVMAWKPSPIQVTWIGYPNTTGLPSIDYRITDGRVDPESSLQPYVEKLIRLPHCFLCYTPANDIPPVAPLPALENEFVTFGSFNNLAKIGPQVVQLWSSVLRAVPDSRLLMKARAFANTDIQKKFLRMFENEGISADRLDLMGLIPACVDHLKTYALMDIALDTFPYAGTTTTCESLLMGVPVVTLKGGSNHAFNVGVSLLSVIGHSELITDSTQAYVAKAVQLANDFKLLSKYRRKLRSDMLSSPLGDGAAFTLNLENLYRQIFTNWCGKAPLQAEQVLDSMQ